MFESCGLNAEPRTTDELIEYCDTIKASDKTALIYASNVGYWEYLYNIWWGQYEGAQGREDFFKVTKDGVISTEVLEQEGILESARVLQTMLNPDSGYSAELVASMDFTKAQAMFISGEEGAMIACGDWLENEMKSYASKIKDDLRIMSSPIISALSDKMSYWTLNTTYSEAVTNQANESALAQCDEKLRALVDYVDGITDTLPAGTTEADADIVREANELEKGNEAEYWQVLRDKRAKLCREYLKNANGIFMDYNFVERKQIDIQIVKDALWRIETDYGVVTCEKNDVPGNYQWGYPNGWAPMQLIVVGGLLRYGFKKEAELIASKFVRLVEKCYEETGHLWEKYNVVTGNVDVQNEYEMPAMLGWTFGVYTWMKAYFREGTR